MKELTYSGLRDDKAEWGDGPWMDEPDKVQWEDPATGLPCLAVRNHFGCWCGYVGVPEGHPAYEKSYDAVHDLLPDLNVHGGLTYTDHCMEGPEEHSICHIPEPGEPDNVWWCGFDCGHAFDLNPRIDAHHRKLFEETGDPIWQPRPEEGLFGSTYRTIDYVRGEITSLAAQLASLNGR